MPPWGHVRLLCATIGGISSENTKQNVWECMIWNHTHSVNKIVKQPWGLICLVTVIDLLYIYKLSVTTGGGKWQWHTGAVWSTGPLPEWAGGTDHSPACTGALGTGLLAGKAKCGTCAPLVLFWIFIFYSCSNTVIFSSLSKRRWVNMYCVQFMFLRRTELCMSHIPENLLIIQYPRMLRAIVPMNITLDRQ